MSIIANENVEKEARKQFFKRYGTIKPPKCVLHNQKVSHYGLDFHPSMGNGGMFGLWFECHGERVTYYFAFDEAIKGDAVMMMGEWVFHPDDKTGLISKGKLSHGYEKCREKRQADGESDARAEVKDWLGSNHAAGKAIELPN